MTPGYLLDSDQELAAASMAAQCAGDVLFLKDGTRLSAKMKSCDEEVGVTDR